LAYLAFRKSMITGEISEFSCLVGTMAQEIYNISPAIRDACGAAMFGHTETLEADIGAAMEKYGISGDWSVASLARHTQGVLQGAFVLAKAGNDPALARESLDHLDRYIRLLFKMPLEEQARS
jgi:TetR/AcrR family transcriptional repressor of nem operon